MDRAQRKAALKAWGVIPRRDRVGLLRSAATGRPLSAPEQGPVLLGWAQASPVAAIWPGLINAAALAFLLSQLGSASGAVRLVASAVACASAAYLVSLLVLLAIAVRVRHNRRLYASSAPAAATVLRART